MNLVRIYDIKTFQCQSAANPPPSCSTSILTISPSSFFVLMLNLISYLISFYSPVPINVSNANFLVSGSLISLRIRWKPLLWCHGILGPSSVQNCESDQTLWHWGIKINYGNKIQILFVLEPWGTSSVLKWLVSRISPKSVNVTSFHDIFLGKRVNLDGSTFASIFII